MKVYIKRNKLHVNAVNNVYFCEATDSLQYHPPDANLDYDYQTVSIFTVCRVALGMTAPLREKGILDMICSR